MITTCPRAAVGALCVAGLAAGMVAGCRGGAAPPPATTATIQSQEEEAVKRIQAAPGLTAEQKSAAIAEERQKWERQRRDAEAYAAKKSSK